MTVKGVKEYTGMNEIELRSITEELVNKINENRCKTKIDILKIIEALNVSEKVKLFLTFNVGMQVVIDALPDGEIKTKIEESIR